jgi:AcrR family transcriptional regulator
MTIYGKIVNIFIMRIGGSGIMPRALTDKEKCRQCRNLLEKGKGVVLSQGMRKISVDDITRAAGVAKGTFYQHFASKEMFLYELVWDFHKHIFAQAEQMLVNSGDLQANARRVIAGLFLMPEMAFFIQNEHEITGIFESVPDQTLRSAKQMELAMFEKLLRAAGINTDIVKPGVVHNYIHTLFLLKGSDLMMEDALQETFDRILDNLMSYIFGVGAEVGAGVGAEGETEGETGGCA